MEQNFLKFSHILVHLFFNYKQELPIFTRQQFLFKRTINTTYLSITKSPLCFNECNDLETTQVNLEELVGITGHGLGRTPGTSISLLTYPTSTEK